MPALIFPAPGFTTSTYHVADIAGGADVRPTMTGRLIQSEKVRATELSTSLINGRIKNSEGPIRSAGPIILPSNLAKQVARLISSSIVPSFSTATSVQLVTKLKVPSITYTQQSYTPTTSTVTANVFNTPIPVIGSTQTTTATTLTFPSGSYGTNRLARVIATRTTTSQITAQSYSGYQYYFDGSTSYVSIASNPNLAFGTGNFTIETWFYITSTAQTSNLLDAWLTNPSYTVGQWEIVMNSNSNMSFYYATTTAAFGTLNTNQNVTANTWHHVAVTRYNGVMTIYLDGIAGTSSTTNQVIGVSNAQSIGRQTVTNTYYYSGYLVGIRYTNYSLYQYYSPVSGQTYFAPINVYTSNPGGNVLQVNGPAVADSGPNNIALTNTATITVTGVTFTPGPLFPYTYPNSTYALYFPGSSSYLSLPSNNLYNIGTNDASIELWVYCTNVNLYPYMTLYGQNSLSNATLRSSIQGGNFTYWINNDTQSRTVMPAQNNTWYHLVLTVTGGTARFFVNGVLMDVYTGWGNSVISRSEAYIIGNEDSYYFPGYITNFRFVNGSIPALYRTNSTVLGTTYFTPPSASLSGTNEPNTVILLAPQGSNGILDISTASAAITITGAVTATSIVTPTPGGTFLGTATTTATITTSSIATLFDGTFNILTATNSSVTIPGLISINTATASYSLLLGNTQTVVVNITSSTTVAPQTTFGRMARAEVARGERNVFSATVVAKQMEIIKGNTVPFIANRAIYKYPMRDAAVLPITTTATVTSTIFTNIVNITGVSVDSTSTTLFFPTQYGASTSTVINGNIQIVGQQSKIDQLSLVQQILPLKFTGASSSYVNFTGSSASLLNFTGDFSIDFWFYPTSTISATEALINTWLNAASLVPGQWQIQLNSNNITFYIATSPSTTVNGTLAFSAAVNVWTHLAFYRTGSGLYLTVNGTYSTGVIYFSSQVGPNINYFRLGTLLANNTNPYDGKIANIRIVNGTSSLFTSTGYSVPLYPNVVNNTVFAQQSFSDISTGTFVPSTINLVTVSPPESSFVYAGLSSNIGDQTFTIPGTYLWVAPAGINSINVVAVGGGGGGTSNGGGGGGLGYKNNITVSQGTVYTVVVGAGGVAGPGTPSYFNTTTIVAGFGGAGCGPGGSYVGDSGGAGGTGSPYATFSFDGYTGAGGGAGGYGSSGGNGGTGGSSATAGGSALTGGGGGGGSGGGDGNGNGNFKGSGGGGGGVGIYGSGPGGTGGGISSNVFGGQGFGATGGSGGGSGNDGSNAFGATGCGARGAPGGSYGGGASSANYFRGTPILGVGGSGAVRIVWGLPSFPNSNAFPYATGNLLPSSSAFGTSTWISYSGVMPVIAYTPNSVTIPGVLNVNTSTVQYTVGFGNVFTSTAIISAGAVGYDYFPGSSIAKQAERIKGDPILFNTSTVYPFAGKAIEIIRSAPITFPATYNIRRDAKIAETAIRITRSVTTSTSTQAYYGPQNIVSSYTITNNILTLIFTGTSISLDPTATLVNIQSLSNQPLITVPLGEIAYTTAGTFSWVAPAGVSYVNVVAIGAGGGGTSNGGGGGGLGWKNVINVTSGTSYTVVVGAGVVSTPGGPSYFNTTTLVAGFGGSSCGPGGSYVGDGGGSGGNGGAYGQSAFNVWWGGGGGAGGYSSPGGAGGYAGYGAIPGSPSLTGGGGGGGSGNGDVNGNGNFGGTGGGGGGVGIYGVGAGGTGGGVTSGSAGGGGLGGGGGSGGTAGGNGGSMFLSTIAGATGGTYGGGGTATRTTSGPAAPAGAPGGGAVRIVWGSTNQISFFPNLAQIAPARFSTTYATIQVRTGFTPVSLYNQTFTVTSITTNTISIYYPTGISNPIPDVGSYTIVASVGSLFTVVSRASYTDGVPQFNTYKLGANNLVDAQRRLSYTTSTSTINVFSAPITISSYTQTNTATTVYFSTVTNLYTGTTGVIQIAGFNTGTVFGALPNYSIYFPGSGSYLYSSSSAFIAPASGGAFTGETWFYPPGNTTRYIMTISSQGAPAGNGFYIYWQNGYFGFNQDNNGTNNTVVNINSLAVTGVLPINTWYHVAVTKDVNNVIRLYVDGLLTASTTYTGPTSMQIATVLLVNTTWDGGGLGINSSNFYISNMRFLNGTALYTSGTYTVPYTFDPKLPTTVFALYGSVNNGVVQDVSTLTNTLTTATGAGTFAFTQVTLPGATTVMPNPAFPQFTGNVNPFNITNYYSGTGTILTISSNSVTFSNIGNISIIPNSTISIAFGSTASIQTTTPITITNPMYTGVTADKLRVRGEPLNLSVVSNGRLANRAIEIVRADRTITSALYTATSTVTDTVSIPQFSKYKSASNNLVDAARVNFYTVSTATVINYQTPITVSGFTQTNTTTQFFYNTPGSYSTGTSGLARIVSTVNVPLTSTVSNIMYFAPGNYIYLPSSVVINLSGDYTVETWVNLSSLPTGTAYNTSFPILALYYGGSLNHIWQITSSGYLFLDRQSSTYVNVTASIPTVGSWAHLAFVNIGTNQNIYLNGKLVGTQTGSGAWATGGSFGSSFIGYNNYAYFNGYMSNFRIVNGTGIYTGNFIPTAPLSLVPNTTVLINTPNLVDSSTVSNTVSLIGSVSSGTQFVSNTVPLLISFNAYDTTSTIIAYDTTSVTIASVVSSAVLNIYPLPTVQFGNNVTVNLTSATGITTPIVTGRVSREGTLLRGDINAFTTTGRIKSGETARAGYDLYYPSRTTTVTTSSNSIAFDTVTTPVAGATGSTSTFVSYYLNDQDILVTIPAGTNLITLYLAGISVNYIGLVYVNIITPSTTFYNVRPVSYTTDTITLVNPGGLQFVSGMRIQWARYAYNYTYSNNNTIPNLNQLRINSARVVDTNVYKTYAITTSTATFYYPPITISRFTQTSTSTTFYVPPGTVINTNSNIVLITSTSTQLTTSTQIVVTQTGINIPTNSGGDYLVLSNTGLLIFTGNANFTVEAWVYLANVNASYKGIIDTRAAATGNPWVFGINGASLDFYNGGPRYTSVTTLTANSWTHVAVVRNSGVIYGYINGVLDPAIYAVNTTIAPSYATALIGRLQDANSGFTGTFTNFRVNNASAIYNPTISVPTQPFVVTTGNTNQLVLSAQTTSTVDYATGYASSLTNTSTGIVISSPLSPFVSTLTNTLTTNGYSIFLNGTNYLGINYQANVGLNDYTGDGWFYFNDVSTSQTLWYSGQVGGNSKISVYIIGGYLYVYASNTNSLLFTSASAVIQTGRWYHIALVRYNSDITLYVNGVSVGSYAHQITTGTNILNITGIANQFYVGFSELTIGRFNGFISNLRFINGQGLYSGNFVPPTSPTAPTGNGILIANSAIIPSVDPSGGYSIINYSNVTTSAYSPFGGYPIPNNGYSWYFNGSNTALRGTTVDLGTTWTVEGWIYPLASSQMTIISFQSSGSYQGLNIWKNGSNQLVVDDGVTAQNAFQSQTFNLNAWNHFAVVRTNNIYSGWINGQFAGVNGNWVTNGVLKTFMIGAYNVTSPGQVFNGYISNIRVINNTAVYNSAFVPSTGIANDTYNTLTNTGTVLILYNTSTNIAQPSNTLSLVGVPSTVNIALPTTGTVPLATNTVTSYINVTNYSVTATVLSTTATSITIPNFGLTFATGTNTSINITVGSPITVYGTTSTSLTNPVLQGTLAKQAEKVSFQSSIPLVGKTQDSYVIRSAGLSISTVTQINIFKLVSSKIADTALVKSYTPTTSTAITYQTPITVSSFTQTNTTTQFFYSVPGVYNTGTTGFARLLINLPATQGIPQVLGGYFNQSSYLYTPDNASQFNVPSGQNFTVEGWVYPTTTSTSAPIFIYGVSRIAYTADLAIFVSASGGSINIAGGGGGATGYGASFPSTMPANQWNHFALVRSNNGATLTAYLNGTAGTPTSAPGAIAPYLYNGGIAGPLGIYIGIGYSNWTVYNPEYFSGYMTSIRFINAQALYTSNFTPSLPAPVVSTGTIVLSTLQTGLPFIDTSGVGNVISNSGPVTSVVTNPSVGGLGLSIKSVQGSVYDTTSTIINYNTASVTVNTVIPAATLNTYGLPTVQFGSYVTVYNTSATTTPLPLATGRMADAFKIKGEPNQYIVTGVKEKVVIRDVPYVSTATWAARNSLSTMTAFYTQSNVITLLAPTTPRERLYYANMVQGKFGMTSIFQMPYGGMPPFVLPTTATVARLESTINTTTFVWTQTSVTTQVAPVSPRERLFYATMAQGKYGQNLVVGGRVLASPVALNTQTGKLTSYSGTGTYSTGTTFRYILSSPGFTPFFNKLSVAEKVRETAMLSPATYASSSSVVMIGTFTSNTGTLITRSVPVLPRENYYYSQLLPFWKGVRISTQGYAVGNVDNIVRNPGVFTKTYAMGTLVKDPGVYYIPPMVNKEKIPLVNTSFFDMRASTISRVGSIRKLSGDLNQFTITSLVTRKETIRSDRVILTTGFKISVSEKLKGGDTASLTVLSTLQRTKNNQVSLFNVPVFGKVAEAAIKLRSDSNTYLVPKLFTSTIRFRSVDAIRNTGFQLIYKEPSKNISGFTAITSWGSARSDIIKLKGSPYVSVNGRLNLAKVTLGNAEQLLLLSEGKILRVGKATGLVDVSAPRVVPIQFWN